MEAKHSSPYDSAASAKAIELETKHAEEAKSSSISPAEGKSSATYGQRPSIEISSNPRAQAIMEGFRILRMSMRDAETGGFGDEFIVFIPIFFGYLYLFIHK